MRLPPLAALYEKVRQIDEAVFDIISRNVRVPDNLLGDLRAQLAAIHIRERGLAELAARWGTAPIDQRQWPKTVRAYHERLARA